MSKGPKDFCRITKYLEIIDEPLFKLYDNFCLLSQFSDREKQGVTFLHPDKKYVKKIADMAYSKNKSHDAIAHLKSFIIKKYIKAVSDFTPNLTNVLGNKVGITESNNKSAECDCGLKVIPQPKFKKLYEQGDYNVFQLSGSGVFDIKTSKKGGFQSDDNKNYTNIERNSTKPTAFSDYVEEVYSRGYANIYKVALMVKGVTSSDKFIWCATARSTFYANIDLVNNEGIKVLEDFINLTDMTTDNVQQQVEAYDVASDAYINANKITVKQPDVKLTEQEALWTEIKQTYKHTFPNNYNKRLYADLMTVLCFICANNEYNDQYPDYDPKSEYKTCSTQIIKRFKSRNDFQVTGTDTAYDYTLLSLLSKSNVYCWPAFEKDESYKPENYDPHSNPMRLKPFDIIGHDSTKVSGGDDGVSIFD
jgi:hypothetical protein